MNNNTGDWYAVQIWLLSNQRSQSWLASRLGITRQTIHLWKKAGKIKLIHQLAIAYVTGESVEQLFFKEEV